ncbi:hypothetical protein KBC75_02015 [Candidatus Shapirobacteria bacterium]|nr:hypothetical protein [Candidatus Shapirobacteria bacterium]
MTTFEGRWKLVNHLTGTNRAAAEPAVAKRVSLVSDQGEQKAVEKAMKQMVTALREPGKHPSVEVIFLEDA